MSSTQIFWYAIAGIIPMAAGVYIFAHLRANHIDKQTRMRARPSEYGWYAVVLTAFPAIAVALIGSLLHAFAGLQVPFTMLIAAALVVAAGGAILAVRHIQPQFRARVVIENVIRWTLISASLISILTTIGIVLSIMFEAMRFFDQVSFWHFVTGTEWYPDDASHNADGKINEGFGAVPLFAVTFLITLIAMLFSVPIGLLSAIYMSEYASPKMRTFFKPVLEVLAGIPTVVYGFFAAITVAPLLVNLFDALGIEASPNLALAPGIVMGVMIIPFISSLSDDVITAVPKNLREGSLALGMTHSETVTRIVVPAALPGIISAFLLGISRALGETMIVVMAAGLLPNLTGNPLETVTTVTVRIVDALTGDQEFHSPETLAAFALALVLFVVTLTLNLVSTIMVHKFKQRYE